MGSISIHVIEHLYYMYTSVIHKKPHFPKGQLLYYIPFSMHTKNGCVVPTSCLMCFMSSILQDVRSVFIPLTILSHFSLFTYSWTALALLPLFLLLFFLVCLSLLFITLTFLYVSPIERKTVTRDVYNEILLAFSLISLPFVSSFFFCVSPLTRLPSHSFRRHWASVLNSSNVMWVGENGRSVAGTRIIMLTTIPSNWCNDRDKAIIVVFF